MHSLHLHVNCAFTIIVGTCVNLDLLFVASKWHRVTTLQNHSWPKLLGLLYKYDESDVVLCIKYLNKCFNW